jgi:hypothetical protein
MVVKPILNAAEAIGKRLKKPPPVRASADEVGDTFDLMRLTERAVSEPIDPQVAIAAIEKEMARLAASAEKEASRVSLPTAASTREADKVSKMSDERDHIKQLWRVRDDIQEGMDPRQRLMEYAEWRGARGQRNPILEEYVRTKGQ